MIGISLDRRSSGVHGMKAHSLIVSPPASNFLSFSALEIFQGLLHAFAFTSKSLVPCLLWFPSRFVLTDGCFVSMLGVRLGELGRGADRLIHKPREALMVSADFWREGGMTTPAAVARWPSFKGFLLVRGRFPPHRR